MNFPLKNYKYDIPKPFVDPGGFGTKRKYDIHTGVDLYCQDGDEVFAIEDGVVLLVEDFTGKQAGSPWWEDTKAIIVRSDTSLRIILYGEITTDFKRGDKVLSGQKIGNVKRVLKTDKGKNPTSMLHIEQYSYADFVKSVVWDHGEKTPKGLIDPTPMLNCLNKNLDVVKFQIYPSDNYFNFFSRNPKINYGYCDKNGNYIVYGLQSANYFFKETPITHCSAIDKNGIGYELCLMSDGKLYNPAKHFKVVKTKDFPSLYLNYELKDKLNKILSI